MKILLAEDEKDMSAALCAILEHSGYSVEAVYDGLSALQKAQQSTYDCLIFDIMMPHLDGVEALRRLRLTGDVTPVIMLTAKTEIDDRITGLDAGADDYLMKPFAMGELLARIRSLTRRANSFTPTQLFAGTVKLDLEEQTLSCKNSIRLNNKETKLMKFLMQNMGKSLTTDIILAHVWSDEDDIDRKIVWIYISYLREKLLAIGADIQIQGNEGEAFMLIEKIKYN